MGRPRKPTKILELSGAFKKDPQRKEARASEPVFPSGAIEPPDWLDMDAREIWSQVVPTYEAQGIAQPVHAWALANLCQALSHAKKAQKKVFRDGITIMTEQGLKKHPALAIFKDSMMLALQYAREFGGLPASQSKVSAKPAEKEVNEFAAV